MFEVAKRQLCVHFSENTSFALELNKQNKYSFRPQFFNNKMYDSKIL